MWEPVHAALRERGVRVEVIEQLPSAGPHAGSFGDLGADVECVTTRLSELGGSVVVCGHSYAGVVMTELAAHPAIDHSVYLTAFWPKEGQSLFDLVGGHPPNWIVPRDDGTLAITDDSARARRALFGDLDDDRAARVHGQLVLQSAASFLAPSTAPVRTHPVTYVLCADDQAIPLALHEAMSAPADDVVQLQSAHFAQLSDPQQVAELLSPSSTRRLAQPPPDALAGAHGEAEAGPSAGSRGPLAGEPARPTRERPAGRPASGCRGSGVRWTRRVATGRGRTRQGDVIVRLSATECLAEAT